MNQEVNIETAADCQIEKVLFSYSQDQKLRILIQENALFSDIIEIKESLFFSNSGSGDLNHSLCLNFFFFDFFFVYQKLNVLIDC